VVDGWVIDSRIGYDDEKQKRKERAKGGKIRMTGLSIDLSLSSPISSFSRMTSLSLLLIVCFRSTPSTPRR